MIFNSNLKLQYIFTYNVQHVIVNLLIWNKAYGGGFSLVIAHSICVSNNVIANHHTCMYYNDAYSINLCTI